MRQRKWWLAAVAAVAGGVLVVPAVNAFSDSDSDAPQASEAVDAAQRQGQEPMPLLELTSGTGSGKLYTLDQEEARQAVADNGMTLSAGRVAYLPREKFDGAKPMYRLKPADDASGWLFTASDDERDKLLADGWTDEGTAGYLYPDDADGRVALDRFSNGTEWRLAPATRADELEQAGFTDDGPLGFVYQQWIRAGAVYFGMFNADGHQRIIDRTEEIYGRKGDWWGGVRDFHDGTHYATDNWPDEDFTNLKPAIGYYDDSDPATLEKQIVQATSAGLSFFNFYWYWDTNEQQESTTDASLAAFSQAGNKNAIDFTVGVCAHPFDGLKIPTEQYDKVSSTLVDKYLSQDNTLRTNDGRKILNICDARGLGDGSPAQIKQFIDTVRAKASDSLGEDIYVMINQGGFDPNQADEAGANGAYCTTDGPAVENRSYADYIGGERDFFAAAPGEYSRCVMSDFDERPRYPIETEDVDAIRWFADQSLDGFRQATANVATDIAESSRPQTVDNIVYVYAWNEWHEGGAIEPSERDGCNYLDVLTEELKLSTDGECQAKPQ